MGQNTQAFRPNCHEAFNKYLLSSAGNGEIFYLTSPSKCLQATGASDEKPESGTRQTWLQNSLPPNTYVSLASHDASHSAGFLVYNVAKQCLSLGIALGKPSFPFPRIPMGMEHQGSNALTSCPTPSTFGPTEEE